MTTSPIPSPRDDDPEDVSWALSTAATSFARGDRVEALKWLRRAAESASEAEKDERALELAKAAAELTNAHPPSTRTPNVTPQMPAVLIPGPPPSRPPPSSPSAPPPSRPSRPTAPPSPESKPALAASADASSPFPLVPPAPETKPGLAPLPTKRMTLKPKPEPRPRVPSSNDERTETLIITEVTKLDEKPAGAAEADAWPTESMGADDLDSLNEVYGQERTRIGSPAYQPEVPAKQKPPKPQKVAFRASQAVHVVIWRDPDGTLRIAPKGTSVSAVTIEALLVAPGPDVDLLAWLTPD